jgi:rhodanese-related sulfurtransferase
VKFLNENIYLIAMLLISGGALLWPVLQRRGSKVSLLQATQMMNQGKTLVLDVRDPDQFAGGHVRDSKNIPLKELASRVGEIDKFKSKSVIVVCNAGIQSSRAAGELKKAGFNEVFSLDGGMTAWQAQGMPTAK